MKRSFILLSMILLVFASCKKKANLKSFSWLSGKWVGRYDSVPIFEQWKTIDGNVMYGRAGAISGKDTALAEQLKIEQRDGELFYVAIVGEGKPPVDFKFTGFDNDTAIFENPQHDFPQRVLYLNNADGTFYACVDGKFRGKYVREEFNYKRLPD
jgi:hypothetical protein